MNKFWDQEIEEVMESNGTNADVVFTQREEAHLDGTCDGGSISSPYACPICSEILRAKARADLRADCERRNARLVKGGT